MKWLTFVFNRHAQALISTLGTLSQRPFSTLLTTLVLGATLALPSFLLLSVQQAQTLSQQWRHVPSLSLFLKTEITEQQAQTWIKVLRDKPQFAQVSFLHKDQALRTFQHETLFQDVTEALGENPLPHLITLVTHPEVKIEGLIAELEQHAFTESVLWDQQWIDTLQNLLTIAQRLTLIMTAFLVSVVLLVLGNTIRLDIENKRQETQIMALLGATDTFIKRPFLYYGATLGLFGGVCALLLTLSTAYLLQPNIEQLLAHYETTIQRPFFPGRDIVGLLLISTSLGYIGAWLSVTWQLHENRQDI